MLSARLRERRPSLAISVLEAVAPVGGGQLARQVHLVQYLGDATQGLPEVGPGAGSPRHSPGAGYRSTAGRGMPWGTRPPCRRRCGCVRTAPAPRRSGRLLPAPPPLPSGVPRGARRVGATRSRRRPMDGAAAAAAVPEFARQGLHVGPPGFLCQCVGGGVLQVVRLVQNEPRGMIQPLVPGDDEGVVQHGDMGVTQAIAGSAQKVALVQRPRAGPETPSAPRRSRSCPSAIRLATNGVAGPRHDVRTRLGGQSVGLGEGSAQRARAVGGWAVLSIRWHRCAGRPSRPSGWRTPSRRGSPASARRPHPRARPFQRCHPRGG